MQRYSDRYRRIVALEFHPTGDEQIVKLVHMQRLPCFAEEKRACLSNCPVTEPMADRLDIGADRRDAARLIEICYSAA